MGDSSLVPMLESLIDDYHLSCVTKGIQVNLDAQEDMEVEMVKFQLYSGLSNIFKNAIESIEASANKHKGNIKVRLFSDNGKIVLEISDNGLGVEKKYIDKMFLSGFTTKEDGHGLGLHALKNFLHSHKSSISLESEGVNRGATLSIFIEEKTDE